MVTIRIEEKDNLRHFGDWTENHKTFHKSIPSVSGSFNFDTILMDTEDEPFT